MVSENFYPSSPGLSRHRIIDYIMAEIQNLVHLRPSPHIRIFTFAHGFNPPFFLMRAFLSAWWFCSRIIATDLRARAPNQAYGAPIPILTYLHSVLGMSPKIAKRLPAISSLRSQPTVLPISFGISCSRLLTLLITALSTYLKFR